MIISKDEIIRTSEPELKLVIRPDVKAIVIAGSNDIEATMEENAELVLITLNDAKTLGILEGDHSRIKTLNFYKRNNGEINIDATSEHRGKNTVSLIRTIGVLSGATATTKGLIRINKTAFDSDGYQKSDFLILKDSKAVSIPNLEIHNDKVKCSHGSTLSRIDENKIFYLCSRGITREQAEGIIVDGFYEAGLKEIPDESIRNEIREVLRR